MSLMLTSRLESSTKACAPGRPKGLSMVTPSTLKPLREEEAARVDVLQSYVQSCLRVRYMRQSSLNWGTRGPS